MAISPARRAAFEILRRVESEDAYSSALLATSGASLDGKDRGLTHELVLGVLRRRLWLDRCIEHFSGRKVEKLDPGVLIALRLGLYQLRFLSRIPPSAAVNESVSLIRAAKLTSAAGFANAVLRRATREPGFDPASSIEDAAEKIAVETSHPLWLIERWIAQIGMDEARCFALSNNNPAPVAFRFTARAGNQADYLLDKLRAAGADVQRSKISLAGWRIDRSEGDKRSSELLRGMAEEGLVYFQDEASQLVAELLMSRDNERILDVCAAPGSKTTLIAAQSPGAAIAAGDLYEHRARTIQQFASQQQAVNVSPITYDATRPLPFGDGSFDRVLVDAPCSGTGTLRHNPEIRWRLQPSDIADLSVRQRSILRNAAHMVRLGGTLIYSTCSVEIEENEAIVDDFRENHPEFEPVLIEAGGVSIDAKGRARTWPHHQDVEGFFVARFQRRNR